MNRYLKSLFQLQDRVYSFSSRAFKFIQQPKNQAKIIGVVCTGALGSNYLLKFDNNIEVKNKYVKIEGPRNLYMVTSTEGKIYKFDKASWKFHWSQAELWNSVEKGEKYKVKGYGIRWPFFGVYPNIHSVKHI